MKTVVIVLSLVAAWWLFQSMKAQPAQGGAISFYDFKVKTLEGDDFDFSSLRGKKVMLVNVASKCGLTPQYEDLEALYKSYGGDAFEIIAFPANNFGKQEPGTHEEIAQFCERNYGVSFPLMEKISVKGDDQHPVYQWLTNKEQNGMKSVSVKWNFQKFLIDEEGRWVDYLLPTTSPQSKKVIEWLSN
jgi:glutathione peroxidase